MSSHETPDSLLYILATHAKNGLNNDRDGTKQAGVSMLTAMETSSWNDFKKSLMELIHLRIDEFSINTLGPDTKFQSQIERIFAETLPALLSGHPDLVDSCHSISHAVSCHDETIDIASCIQFICDEAACRGISVGAENPLVEVFVALIDNISMLSEEDSWFATQILLCKDAILSLNGTSDVNVHFIAEKIKEISEAQSIIKRGLRESRKSTKAMVETLIDRLDVLANESENHHTNISSYLAKFDLAKNPDEFKSIVLNVLNETQSLQKETFKSRLIMSQAKDHALAAERRVMELESKLKALGELSMKDPLTGCLNRRGLDDSFEKSVALCLKQDYSMCVAVLDIDNFKRINDTLGHEMGDRVLVGLTAVIQKAIRGSDAVARFGGEEFLILLPGIQTSIARKVIERIQKEFKDFFENETNLGPTTFSCGVTQFIHGESLQDVMSRADISMYKAKKSGKDCIIVDGVLSNNVKFSAKE